MSSTEYKSYKDICPFEFTDRSGNINLELFKNGIVKTPTVKLDFKNIRSAIQTYNSINDTFINFKRKPGGCNYYLGITDTKLRQKKSKKINKCTQMKSDKTQAYANARTQLLTHTKKKSVEKLQKLINSGLQDKILKKFGCYAKLLLAIMKETKGTSYELNNYIAYYVNENKKKSTNPLIRVEAEHFILSVLKETDIINKPDIFNKLSKTYGKQLESVLTALS
jgi:hypothetical protein